MAYQMAAMAVTLNDLEGHSQAAGLLRCNPSNIFAAFYIQLTVCWHGSSALAELLVEYYKSLIPIPICITSSLE